MATAKQGERDEGEQDRLSQRKRGEPRRFHVRVDRQTKASYETAEQATAAAVEIKARHPAVQVSVFDAEDRSTTIVQTPDAE